MRVLSSVVLLLGLHIAAQCGHVELCDVLINHGSVINASDYQHGYTPLHLAAQNGHQAIIVCCRHHMLPQKKITCDQ